MGTVCARCSDMQKAGPGGGPPIPGLNDSDDDGAGLDDKSEVDASSEGEEDNAENYKQDVEEILKSTGQGLKRGKTMAMKEAISTAKKVGLDSNKIDDAEHLLDNHKKQQLRDEVEAEVNVFLNSRASRDIPSCEAMIAKAQNAECKQNTVQKLQTWLEEIINTRSLEDEEVQRAREFLKQSCREFVLAATHAEGRPVVYVNLDDGRKKPAILLLDPPLQNLRVTLEGKGTGTLFEAPVASLTAVAALKDKKVQKCKGFKEMEEGDAECAVAVRYDISKTSGVICLVEPTPVRRDRLIEAVIILTTACS